jgi:hypothetical protein
VQEFKRLCTLSGNDRWTVAHLAQHFECSIARVKNLKRSLGLTQSQAREQVPEHVTFGWLQTRWTSDHHNEPLHRSAHVAIARHKLAMELGVSDRTLERHMKNLGFNCMNPYTDDEVGACMRMILLSAWCCKIGVGFAETRLRLKFGMVVRREQIARVLKHLDPAGVRRRTRKGKKKKGAYNVKGPRSLYHLDAHEKLAKVWGKTPPAFARNTCAHVHCCLSTLTYLWFSHQEFGFMDVLMGIVGTLCTLKPHPRNCPR